NSGLQALATDRKLAAIGCRASTRHALLGHFQTRAGAEEVFLPPFGLRQKRLPARPLRYHVRLQKETVTVVLDAAPPKRSTSVARIQKILCIGSKPASFVGKGKRSARQLRLGLPGVV